MRRSPQRVFLGLLAIVAISAAAAAPAARAEEYLYRLDPASTEVRFLLDAMLHKVRGTARLERGEIRFDDSGAARGEVVVDATSAETGNEKRDRDMHRKVLESDTHPEIVLVAEGFEGRFDGSAPSDLTVAARLRIHGGEHPLELRMRLQPSDGRMAATTTFTVPYVAWGMKNPSTLFLRVAKQVEVTIEAQGTLEAVP